MNEFQFDSDIDPTMNYDFFNDDLRYNCKSVSLTEYLNSFHNRSSFSILNYNIRSFNENFDKFSCGFRSHDLPHVLCLTETWFSSNSTSNIPNYSGHHVIRDGRSGGISFYVNNQFNSSIVSDFSYANPTIEVCTIEVNIGSSVIILIGVYRPHSDSITNFNAHLSTLLENQFFNGRTCIFLGDINICLFRDDPAIHDYVNLLSSHHFFNLITKPTRYSGIDGVAPSLLDHIFVNEVNSFDYGIIDLDLTDHLPTYLNINLSCSAPDEKIRIQFRDMNDSNKNTFHSLIANYDWDSLSCQDSNVFTENFLLKLNLLYQTAFPLKTKLVSKKKILNPWVTPHVEQLIKAKSDYFFYTKIIWSQKKTIITSKID